MLKKFLCVFAMALLLVACDGKSGKKISSDDDDDDKKEFNTGYAVFDEGLERLNKVCKKVKKVETLDELDVLENEFVEVISKWEKENHEQLDSLWYTKGRDKFIKEYEKMELIFSEKRAKLRENSYYGCDSVATAIKVVEAAAECPADYYYEQDYYADSAKAEYDYYEAPAAAAEYYDEPYYY